MMESKISYIHQDPVRVVFVQDAEDYLYSSARNYAGVINSIPLHPRCKRGRGKGRSKNS
jgi:hypothetical protein